MNLAEYLLNPPKTLEERRKETSKQFRRERNREYSRKKRAKKCTNTEQQ